MKNKDLEELVENFALFDDWEERYRYLIDLGRGLALMDEGLKTEEHLVKGCTARVWMVAGVKDGRFEFTADSDAHIVRGLIAVLQEAYGGRTPEEVRETDIEDAFAQMGLDQNLSPNRRNGFFAMVEEIKRVAGG